MVWQDQGRQEHGHFGHGTGPANGQPHKHDPGAMFEPGNIGQRIDAVAHTALMHMPRKDWHLSALSFDGQRLAQLRQAMSGWISARSLSHTAFEASLVDPTTSNAAVTSLRAAAEGVRTAETHQDLAAASAELASGIQGVGINKWPGFLRDAADRSDTYKPVQAPSMLAQAATPKTSSDSGSSNANNDMHTSSQGRADLRLREGVSESYYNDDANNCTSGVGQLVYAGSCSPNELQMSKTDAEINMQLDKDIAAAEAIVKAQVRDRRLTQEQFDAAVSFAFNSGAAGSKNALSAVNRGDNKAARQEMKSRVYIHNHDKQGRSYGPPIKSHGLANRREKEAAPFHD